MPPVALRVFLGTVASACLCLPVAAGGTKRKDNSLCLVCHGDLRTELIAVLHLKEGITCAECHGASMHHMHDEMLMTKPDVLFGREEVEPFCKDCHRKHQHPARVEAFRKENLGRDRPNGRVINEESICTDCHGLHNIVKERKRASRRREETSWISLFSGTDLASWRTEGPWRVRRGRMEVSAAGAGHAEALRLFPARYFRFFLTYRPEGKLSAAVRWLPEKGQRELFSILLLDPTPKGPGPGGFLQTGRCVVRNVERNLLDPEGWNTLGVLRTEETVRVWLNGVFLYQIAYKEKTVGKLTLSLQVCGGGTLAVREVKVQVLSEAQ